MPLVKYETFYLPSKQDLLNVRWKGILVKYGESLHELEVKSEADAFTQLSKRLNEMKKTLPKEYLSTKGSVRKCQCAVIRAEEPRLELIVDNEWETKTKDFIARSESNFTSQDKLEAFHILYAHAIEVWQNKERGESCKDVAQCAFEAMMEQMLAVGDKKLFWEAYNKLPE